LEEEGKNESLPQVLSHLCAVHLLECLMKIAKTYIEMCDPVQKETAGSSVIAVNVYYITLRQMQEENASM
jgi:hypothetical protein